MAEFVEGDWKDFTFKMAQPEDYQGILQHLRENFYRDEPINKHLGDSETKSKDMDTIGLAFLAENLSFLATDKNTGKIAGVRVTGISRKEDKPEELFAILESPEAKQLIPNILELYGRSKTYERLSIDHYGDFLYVSVDREYRGLGLATEMYNRAIKLLKSKRFPAAQSIFTSPYSQQIAKKMGFVELARKDLKDFKTISGDRLFPNVDDDEVAIVMALKLESD